MMLILHMSSPADNRNSIWWDIIPSMATVTPGKTSAMSVFMILNLQSTQDQESATFSKMKHYINRFLWFASPTPVSIHANPWCQLRLACKCARPRCTSNKEQNWQSGPLLSLTGKCVKVFK